MGAAQDDVLHVAVAEGEEKLLEVGVDHRALPVSLLHQFRQTPAGQGDDPRLMAEGRRQHLVFLLVDGQGGGHDDDLGAVVGLGGGLHRRLDADDGDLGVLLPEEGDGGAGGGVAGHHDGLGPPVQQLLRPPEGEGPDLLQGLFPVGGVGGVPEEEKVLVGEKPGAGPEDAHAPQTRIEDPDGAVLVGHAATPFSLCALCKGIPAQFHAHGLLADASGSYHKNPRQCTKGLAAVFVIAAEKSADASRTQQLWGNALY